MNARISKKIRKELRQVNREVVLQFYRAIAQQPFRRKLKMAMKVLISGWDKRLRQDARK